jgi:hypothetical protein
MVQQGEPLEVLVRLLADAVPLAPLEVLTRRTHVPVNVALAGFHERSRQGRGGTFILREEIDTRQPKDVSDLLATVGSFVVAGETVSNNRTQCEPAVFIDGLEVRNAGSGRVPRGRGGNAAWAAVNSVHWTEVEGIEAYAGAATIPALFAGARRAGCGVIAIWLRRGPGE